MFSSMKLISIALVLGLLVGCSPSESEQKDCDPKFEPGEVVQFKANPTHKLVVYEQTSYCWVHVYNWLGEVELVPPLILEKKK